MGLIAWRGMIDHFSDLDKETHNAGWKPSAASNQS
jgi:hypothetical protein